MTAISAGPADGAAADGTRALPGTITPAQAAILHHGRLLDSEDADAPGGVLDHGQDVGPGAIEQFRGEKVTRHDRLGLRAQEQRPGWSGPSRHGADPGILQDFPYRRRCYFHS